MKANTWLDLTNGEVVSETQRNSCILVNTAEIKHWTGAAAVFSLTRQLVSLHSSLSAAQPLNKYWLYFKETIRKQNSVHSNHPAKTARNPHSSLFLLPCSDISGMEEKNLFSQRNVPKSPPPPEKPVSAIPSWLALK